MLMRTTKRFARTGPGRDLSLAGLALAVLPVQFAAWLRGINWVAAGITVALEGLLLIMLMSMGVVPSFRPEQRDAMLVVLPAREAASAAPAPSPPEADLEPVVTPQPSTAMVVPQPRLELNATEPVAAATAPPAAPQAAPRAAPVAPVAAAEGPPGPVSVANINTNLLSGPPPAYPRVSRRKREQGTVVLRIVVSEDGRVSTASVSRSSGFPELDEAALTAVRKWRWSPTIRDGKPTAITGVVQIPFVLRDA